MAEMQETGERFKLLARATQHVEGDVQRFIGLEIVGQCHINFGLGLPPGLVFKARRQGRSVHIADGRHVILGYPLPKV